MNNEPSDSLITAAEEVPEISTGSEPDAGLEEAKVKVEPSGEEILQRMAVIRLRIDEHTDQLVAQVNALSDWRSHVRRHPWLSVSAAAAIGYLIVPSRAKNGAMVAEPRKDGSTRSSAAEELKSVMINAAKKAATAYASKSLGNIVSGFVEFDKRA